MATISYLTRIEFDDGAITRLPVLLDGLKVARPLLVTDRGLMATGLVEHVAGLLAATPAVLLRYAGQPDGSRGG